MLKLVFYLPQYAKKNFADDLGFPDCPEYLRSGRIRDDSDLQKVWKKIGFLNFVELLISDGLVIMLPIAYVVVRILTDICF